jgi:Zn finger protein HypA/HybF involved in hydrogenase expression
MGWEDRGSFKVIRCDSGVETTQKKWLGFGGRVMVRLQCSNCHKITMLDETIRYNYCPHCGTKMVDEK